MLSIHNLNKHFGIQPVLKNVNFNINAGERIGLIGSNGSGKTTLIKELCKILGSQDHFSSPTYSIVNEYVYPGGKLFHFDLYRLKNLNELLDIGFEDYLYSGQYCFIEWPELAKDLINSDYVKIHLNDYGSKRLIGIEKSASA